MYFRIISQKDNYKILVVINNQFNTAGGSNSMMAI